MSQSIKYILFSLFFLSSTLLFSQSKTQLEKEKQELDFKIKQTNNLLNKEKKKKNSALKQLELSNKKIKHHSQLLKNLKESIKIQNDTINEVEKQISKSEETIINKEEQIENLKDIIIKKPEQIKKLEVSIIKNKEQLTLTQNTLSKIIYQTYVWTHTYNERFFLISSDDLNQLYKRKQYLNQLTEKTSQQINKVKNIKEELDAEKKELDAEKKELDAEKKELDAEKKELETEKQNLINERELLKQEKANKEELFSEKQIKNKTLEKEKNNNSRIVSEIKQNEQHYRNKLNQQKKEAKEIEEQIKKIIEEEIRKSREEAEKNNSGSPLTPEALELSSNFTANKGNLPWPLEKGVIVSSFGIQKNKAISGIETKNNGIDFSTDPGQNCRVIFDGTISRIFFIKGKGKAVLVNHGNYFTVYSGLQDVIVKSGDQVIAKQKIGKIITSETTRETQLHFEIWKGKETQNPVKWLYKAN
jgi:septal ring factor EnvC (AmiA/AmiB activator)